MEVNLCIDILGAISPILQNATEGGGNFIPNWIPEWLRISGILFGGGAGAYLIRQCIERRKLRRAIKTEIRGMKGIQNCYKSLDSRKKPSLSSARSLEPKDVPPEESIPTKVYEENISRLGLLKTDELEDIVEFYTDVLRYKSTISAIRSETEVPEPDQNELWESIGDLKTDRHDLFEDGWIETEGDGEASGEGDRDDAGDNQ